MAVSSLDGRARFARSALVRLSHTGGELGHNRPIGDLAQTFLLALLAMFNPTLLAVVTLLLLLPSPKRLMVGYLLGAYVTSISLGLVIVFALQGSGFASTSRNAISPAEDLVLGLLALLVAFVLRTDRDRSLRDRRARRKLAKQEAGGGEERESLPLRMLGSGSPRTAFVVGLVLSFPGASYLAGLGHIDKLGAATVPTALLVVAFCLIQQLLLEVPLAGYLLDPERTQERVDRFRAWLGRNGRRGAVIAAAAIGLALIARGLFEVLG
jgi:Sap, sulfolipid-1-addressing protein